MQEVINKTRNPVFDVAKGFGICAMVFGHASFPLKNFVYMFHMALFFIISGYFFKKKSYSSWHSLLSYLKKTLLRLWLPYVILMVLLILLHNFCIDINLYTNNNLFMQGDLGNHWGLTEYYSNKRILFKILNVFYFGSGEQLAGALWFLKALFYILSVSAIGHYFGNILIKNPKIYNIIEGCIYFCLLLTGYYLSIKKITFFGFGTMCTSSFLVYLGMLFQRKYPNLKINNITFFISCIILYILYLNKLTISVASNEYSSFLGMVIASIAGFIFIIYISDFVTGYKNIKNCMSYIGRNTMPILCLHFIFFKLVTLMQIYYYHLPLYELAAFPTYYTNHIWWLLYGIAGILCPLVCYELWSALKLKIINYKNK